MSKTEDKLEESSLSSVFFLVRGEMELLIFVPGATLTAREASGSGNQQAE
ncbi:hypothetical protein M3204_08090 [Mesobacillus subterraneus]|nr:hypothetical protein [Mesobacillus subterraneus]